MQRLRDNFKAFNRQINAEEILLGHIGQIINGVETVQAIGQQPNYVYVRITSGNDQTGVLVAECRGAVPKYDMPVRVKMDELLNHYVIIGTDPDGIIQYTPPGVAPSASGVGWHNHNDPGLWDTVTGLRLAEGLVYQSTPASLVVLSWAFPYMWNGVQYVHSSDSIDLTAYVPASGNTHAWVMVLLDPTTSPPALVAIAGAAVGTGIPLTTDMITSIAFTNKIPLSAIQLTNGETAIQYQGDFLNLRNLITGVGGVTSGTYAPAASKYIIQQPDATLVNAQSLSALATGYVVNVTGTGVLAVIKSNLVATVAPTTANDNTQGYGIGSQWIDTVGKKSYVLVDATTSAAVWDSTTTGSLLTTKGDLLTYGTTDIRLGVGADYSIYMADSGAATGNRYTDSSTSAILLPVGTTAQKPTNAVGLIRYNTTTGRYEFSTASAWVNHTRLTGDTMTGALEIDVATTTSRALILKTTDDNTTDNLLEFLSSTSTVLANVGATGLARFAGINNTPIGDTTRSTVGATNVTITSGGYIRPAADSTAAIFITKADGTTAIMTIDTTDSSLGINVAPTAFAVLNFQGTSTDTTTNRHSVVNGVYLASPSADTGGSYYGYYADIHLATNVNLTNTQVGGGLAGMGVVVRHLGTATVSKSVGLSIQPLIVSGGGTVAVWDGIEIANPTISGGSAITSITALRILSVSGATNNFAIVTGTGLNQFGDQILLVGSADRDQFVVRANSAQASNHALLRLQSSGGSTDYTVFNNIGLITKYNADTTAGNGVASIAGSVSLTGQTASVAATNIFTPPANGMYEASIYLEDTTSSTSGGTVWVSIIYTDDNGSQTQSTGTLVLSATGFLMAQFTFFAKTSAAIQYSTTVGGVIVGSPQYAVRIILKRLS